MLARNLLIDRSGFVGADGKTHQGLFDLSYLNNIPNMKIWTPSSYSELSQMIHAGMHENCPVAIRYSKTLSETVRVFEGNWNIVKSTDDICKIKVLAVGYKMLETALKAAGEFVEVVDVTTVKPLDYKYLNGVGSAKILTLEENVKSGGFGESVAAYLASCNRPNVVKSIGR